MALSRLRSGLKRFFAILDAEGVALFQSVVYVHIVGAGIYLLTAADGVVPQSVEDTLGPAWNAGWLWACIGPSVCLAGKAACHTKELRYAGLWMQLSGDLMALGALVVFVAATLGTSWWGRAVFAVFICAAIAECILLVVVRDIRRIEQVEREIRR